MRKTNSQFIAICKNIFANVWIYWLITWLIRSTVYNEPHDGIVISIEGSEGEWVCACWPFSSLSNII